jgi:NAD/NADP transhydrogenase beta subunit
MFYMPGTKMLFGDAKDSCDGKLLGYVEAVLLITHLFQPSNKASRRETETELLSAV